MISDAAWDDLAPMIAGPAGQAVAAATVARMGTWPELNGWRGRRVTDVCAGLGRYALALAEAGAVVTANDASASRLGLLLERAAERALACETLCADARELPATQSAEVAFLGGNLPGLWLRREADIALFASLAGHVVTDGFLALELVSLEQELLRFEPFRFSERNGMVVTERRRWLPGERTLAVSISAHSDAGRWEHAYERAVRSVGEWELLLAQAGWRLVRQSSDEVEAAGEASSLRTLMLLQRGES